MLSDAGTLLMVDRGTSPWRAVLDGVGSLCRLVAVIAVLIVAIASFGSSNAWAEDPSRAVSAPAVAAGAGSDASNPAAPTDADTAANAGVPQSFQSLDEEAQALKQQVMDLNRELFMLEEDLLFPASTQVAVYVSYDVGTFFALDSVQVRVDDKEVANYLYTAREVDALQRGGVHRIWLGNLKVGQHVITAFFTGKGPHERDYRTGATIQVDKGVGAKYLELKISDRQQKLQPEFIVKQWD